MTRDIEGFKGLKPFMQRAVILKANGESNASIAQVTSRSVKTIERWFGIDGLLKKPLQQYSEALANEALAEAKVIMRQALPSAIQTLRELATTSTNVSVRQQAARTLAQPSIVAVAKSISPIESTPGSRALSEMLEAELMWATNALRNNE